MGSMPEPESLDMLLGQVCRLRYARVHMLLEDVGLYRGQPPMLHALWRKDGLTHSELAARLHVQPATMTRMVRRVEKAGFVERRSDAEDQRLSRVYLTDGGRAVRGDVEQVWRTMEAETFDGLSEEGREVLRRSLLRVRENLIRATEDKPPW